MTLSASLALYTTLDKIAPLRKNYTAKIMSVAFLGTHIPLLALLGSFVLSNTYSWEMGLRILGIALLATLVGTAVTLYALNHLLVPVLLAVNALKAYRESETLESLPIQFTDEAGTLMADTARTLQELDALIHHVTHYDDITGLPKYDLFCTRLTETLQNSTNPQQLLTVLVLGIDDFVNLSHGLERNTLDLLLRAVTQRLKSESGQNISLSYVGKSEFALALLDLPSFETVIKLSQLLLSMMAKPFLVNGQLIHITASIGITITSLDHPEVAGAVDKMLQQAQISLHQSQQERRNQYRFYSPELNIQIQERLALENALHGALDREEMVVYYQPLFDLKRGEITAVEALVRWQHPTLGLVSPDKFIPLAEANGFIVPLGEWVLRTACAQSQAWRSAGLPSVRMSVNLSARQFEQPNLLERVQQILGETALDPRHLELEVTESFLITDLQRSVKVLNGLRDMGISVALDDFGTGYSSLSYLKRFPINMLKIDRSFVVDVLTNADSVAVTDAIIALAQGLGLSITAEGIETQEQLTYLKQRGCEEGQGYYFGRPVPATAIAQQLQALKQLEPVGVTS